MYAPATASIASRFPPSYSPFIVALTMRGIAAMRLPTPGVSGRNTRASAVHANRRRSALSAMMTTLSALAYECNGGCHQVPE
ncbi:hypothetical protein GCM10018962_19970 [Dactylosporangium matsuzakiense]